MQSLKKVTSEFIETEDRIRLSALNTDNKTVAFWLTQRLLSRLVTHLSKQLKTNSTEVRNTKKSEYRGYSDSGGAVAPQSPVKIEKSDSPTLITEVDI